MLKPTRVSPIRTAMVHVLHSVLAAKPERVPPESRQTYTKAAALGVMLATRTYCMTHGATLLSEVGATVCTAVTYGMLDPASAHRVMRLAIRAAHRAGVLTDAERDRAVEIERLSLADATADALARGGTTHAAEVAGLKINMPGVGRA